MSQTSVEQVQGRMIIDERSRSFAATSLQAAFLQEGYRLYLAELRLLSGLGLQSLPAGLTQACAAPGLRLTNIRYRNK